MRRARTLVAGAALGFAALTCAVPTAYADAHGSDGGSAEKSAEKSWPGGDGSSWESKDGDEHHKGPHGGPHAGVGILDDGAGVATGAALVAGGLG
ncbi:MAG: hypothetical protein HOV68_08095, partial [Streptomycetaceae bacterium]|nr:hypothetical protein [Streptomycetaceae bacterium]